MKRKKGIKVLCFGLVALFLTICIGTKNYDVSAADTLELSDGCTIEIDSITPKNDIEASAYISGFLIQNVEDCYGGFLISANPGDYTSGSLSVMCIAGTETYDNVKIKYREENKEVSRKIVEYVGELHGTDCFPVNDLDLIDYYKSGCKSDTYNAFAYFSSEYKERFKNTNISLIIDVRAGDGGNFFTVLAGIGSLYYDGIAYAASEFLGGSLENEC